MYEKLVEARQKYAAGLITLGELFLALDAFLNEVNDEDEVTK